jgi:hypothetical protein
VALHMGGDVAWIYTPEPTVYHCQAPLTVGDPLDIHNSSNHGIVVTSSLLTR